MQTARFENVFCSQCGVDFGPGEHGFSHCDNHQGMSMQTNDSGHVAGGKLEADTSVMTDRELTELAAKAVGLEIRGKANDTYYNAHEEDDTHHQWNPLEDDGDALRLAVMLSLDLIFYGASIDIRTQDRTIRETERLSKDPCAATRRVIVRAAAEIAKAK